MKLRTLRRIHNYTQIELAELLNCKQNTYSQYENYKRAIPIETLKSLAQIYETSVDFLLDMTDTDLPYPRKKSF